MSGYIGTQPVPQATQTRDSFTATSGQTTFATGGYTPNFLDVYLNGVKLASADYTATNGSDVVLASGAATGDILEVVAFTTFNSASSSIDDNGNATAITIDSSENVMVGTTNSNPTSSAVNVAGQSFSTTGGIRSTVTSNAAATFNRKTDDGGIVLFRKDGTTVGSVATQGSRLSIGSGDVNLNFNASANSMYPISDPAAGTLSSGIVDLGAALATFKDAYLSGGVYLGGTGSANKLDDYESGTWTPSLISAPSGISLVGTTIHNNYTKIGNFVFLTGYIELNTGSSSANPIRIGGLPFSPRSVNAVAGSLINRYASSDTYSPFLGNSSQIEFYKVNNTGNWNLMTYSNVGNPFSIHFTINYQS
jgi:hypothetical protein